MTATHTRRHFFRYSLRTLFIVVTVFCVVLGTVVKQARDQRSAIEVIQEVGGNVTYEHQRTNSAPPGPEWLRKLMGDEYFFTVDGVEFGNSKVDDTSLSAIKQFTNLTRLTLADTEITDAGLEHIKDLTDLEVLKFYPARRVTDAGMAHLKGLKNLRTLILLGTKMTDAGLAHIEGLTTLGHLNVNSGQITDRGLVRVESLTNLKVLVLNNTEVSGEGIKRLQKALPSCAIYCLPLAK